MSYNSIQFEIDNHVAKITLNRPDVLNSFDMPMGKELQSALQVCAENDDVRAVYLTGAGRAFCAGQDLAEAAPTDKNWPAINSIVEETYNPIILGIRNLLKPVVCAVNGVAAGAGANIALACDIVVASEKASFLQAFCHIGLIPDSGGTYFLPRLVGLQQASVLTMLGEKIAAEQALNLGLIYKVFSVDEFEEKSYAIASHLSTQATVGLGLTKQLLNESLANDLETQLKREEELQAKAAESEDYTNAVNAFLAKEKVIFKGK